MRIAVVELEEHPECLYSFCKIFTDTREEVVTIYCNQKVFRELKGEVFLSRFEWIVKPDEVSIHEFLQTQKDSIDSHDVLIFNTVQKNFLAYCGHEFKPKTILRIHNVHTFFKRWGNMQLQFTPYFLWKDFSYIVRVLILQRDWNRMDSLVKEVDYVTFPDETIEGYALDNQLVSRDKVFKSIPLGCSSNEYKKEESTEAFHITVSGAIDPRRRDYFFLADVWEDLLKELKRPVKLTFLGKPISYYGQQVLQRFKAMENDLFHLQAFEERVPQSLFNEVMKETDLMLAPIILHTRYKIYKERYGYTKISGGAGDVVRYGKAAIFPSDYPFNELLKQVVDRYDSAAHLKELLLAHIHGEVKNRTTAIQCMQQAYTPEILQSAIVENLKKIID